MAEHAAPELREIDALTREVVRDLRSTRNNEASASDLTNSQQGNFNELAQRCLTHIVDDPQKADGLIKLGPAEYAYALPILNLGDAVLRLHYYTDEGVALVEPNTFSDGVVDTTRFGRPHSHRGDIAAAVPVGTLIHHTFGETEGDEYVTGGFQCTIPSPGRQVATFIPSSQGGLEARDTILCTPDSGYWMNGRTTHVVSWPKPTITAVINDLEIAQPSRTYVPDGEVVLTEIVQTLDAEERAVAWNAFTQLARTAL